MYCVTTDCVSYGQLYLDTLLERSLSQNALRVGDERIDESVIVKMHERLEVPDPHANAWEAHSLTVTNNVYVKVCIQVEYSYISLVLIAV